MKISNLNAARMYKAYDSSSSGQVSTMQSNSMNQVNGSGLSKQDKINLSGKAQQMNEVDKAVTATPAIRKDKIAQLEKSINAGSYQADYGSIASKLLSHDIKYRI